MEIIYNIPDFWKPGRVQRRLVVIRGDLDELGTLAGVLKRLKRVDPSTSPWREPHIVSDRTMLDWPKEHFGDYLPTGQYVLYFYVDEKQGGTPP